MKKFFRLMALAIFSVFFTASCGMQSFQLPDRAAYRANTPKEVQDKDDAECKQFASERTGGYDPNKTAMSGAITEGAVGALAGAALGAAFGSIWGQAGSGALGGGAAGLTGGGLHGATGELARMHSLYTRQYSVCMRSKGYMVE